MSVVGLAAFAAGTLLAASWLHAAWRGFQARRRAALVPSTYATQSAPLPGDAQTPPFVSVIVPAWEEHGVLERCIAALREVEYPAWETVIVAGGSDGTYAAALEASRGLPGCRVIEQQPRGKPVALNDGIAAAGGDVVVFLDADSEVSPSWLRELVAPLDRTVRASTGNPIPARVTPISTAEQMERITEYEIRGRIVLQGSGSIAVTRDALREVGEFPEDAFADDWELDARLAARGVGRAFCRAATLRTDRPATLQEFWRNEIRWRRAHLASLGHVREYFLGDLPTALRSVHQYVLAWLAVVMTGVALASLLLGPPDLRLDAVALWVAFAAWFVLRRIGLTLGVAAYTRESAWLRDAWAPVLLTLVASVACVLASLTTRRATLRFQGPRTVSPAAGVRGSNGVIRPGEPEQAGEAPRAGHVIEDEPWS